MCSPAQHKETSHHKPACNGTPGCQVPHKDPSPHWISTKIPSHPFDNNIPNPEHYGRGSTWSGLIDFTIYIFKIAILIQ